MERDSTSRPDRLIFQGRKIDVVLRPRLLKSGEWSEREVVVHPGAVALVPMVDSNHVCLVRNHRHSVGKVLLEVPAGTLEPGESPELTAARELKEETGYTAGSIRWIATWFVSPGVMTEQMHLYLCEDLIGGELALEPDENLEPIVVEWEEALRMVFAGEIVDAKTIASILLCDRLKRA
jgi:ADP-ribose pyrophosphatase